MAPSYWDKVSGWFTYGDKSCSNRACCQSDHENDYLISPVTNPFFFEDPRSLTEVRPIFIYQSAPSKNPYFNGGHSEFFGMQGRVAITDRFSLVLNELGLVSLNPNNPTPQIGKDTGFAEVKVGPKYTFLRNCCTGSVLAGGLTFEIPAGTNKVFQNTGNLGLDPYITYGQRIRLPAGFGSLNFMTELGYSFSVDSKRSEFLHNSYHLDYNVAGLNKIYPLIELNWFHYTQAGKNFVPAFGGIEGADLVNFGSTDVGNRDLVTLAVGARYKFTEQVQVGAAAEWALTRHDKTLSDFRFTVDLILRY
jgi:hypothetical protein